MRLSVMTRGFVSHAGTTLSHAALGAHALGGNMCDPLLNHCESCGGNSQRCCAGGSCAGRRICDTMLDQCEPCGRDDQRCCPHGLCDGIYICNGDIDRCQLSTGAE